MSTRIFAITVILREPINEAYADRLIDAIKLYDGVADATKLPVHPELYFAKVNAHNELVRKLYDALDGDE